MKCPLIRKGDYIYGSFVIPEKRKGFINDTNPGDRKDIIGRFPFSTWNVGLAVQYAKAVQIKWRQAPYEMRRKAVMGFIEQLKGRANIIADIIMRETGTPLLEAKQEIEETSIILKALIEAADTEEQIAEKHQPIGVIGILCPSQLPIQCGALFSTAAILNGNTVVHKPSKYAPGVGQAIAELWDRSLLTRGVYNMVQGPGSIIGQHLIEEEGLSGLIAASSYTTAQKISSSTKPNLRLWLHMGGKCTALVDENCDLDLTATELIASFCRASGQRPDAVARIIVVDKIIDKLIEKMRMKIARLRIGYGSGASVDMGPLISESVQRRYIRFGKSLENHGHQAIIAAEAINIEGWNGFYIKPALYLIDWRQKESIDQFEPPGPIGLLYAVQSLTEGIELHNQFSSRRMCSIFSNDLSVMESAFIDTGAIYANKAPKEEAHSYCGRGSSSNGALSGIGALSNLRNDQMFIKP